MADIIQGLWIGATLGPLQRLSIASFLAQGHPYHLYTYGDLPNVPAGVTLCDGNEVLPAVEIFCYQHGFGRGSVAAFANLFRYKLLLERGGWWADTDFVCLRPFDFTDDVVYASEATAESFKLTNAILKLPAGHEVARRCYEEAAQVDRQTVEWGMIGPNLLTRVVRAVSPRADVTAPVVFCPVPWWSWQTLLDPDPRECLSYITPQSYAVHLWNEMWRQAGLQQQTSFSPSCYLAQIFRAYRVDLS